MAILRSSLLAAAVAIGSATAQSSSNTATIDLSTTRGVSPRYASGFIYGMPNSGFGQSPNQIPNSFYTNMGFNYARAGGAQMTQGGWVQGLAAYKARFQSTLQNYQKTVALGGRFQILPHDVWGTDHANSTTVWPGDNGDFTDYDKFLTQLFNDLASNNAITNLDWDLWNEADGSFWARSEAQYLAMWNHTYVRLRSDSRFNAVPIVGPSSASQPYIGNNWWQSFLTYTVANNVFPDILSWHDEPGDVANDIANLTPLLQKYNAPLKPININEYATFDQQNSASAAWWISRLERYNVHGLRGNWLSTCQLHNYMASLLATSNMNSCTATPYYPNGEYQVYQYYNLNMTGPRATTTTSGDGVIDVYTTIGSTVKILTGVNNNIGTWYITINNLAAIGLPVAGTLNIQTYGFADSGHTGQQGAPSNRGIYGHVYSGNSVTFPVYQTNADAHTAWVFEFAPGPTYIQPSSKF